MVDVHDVNVPLLVRRVHAVPFRQPMQERAGLRMKHLALRCAVCARKQCRPRDLLLERDNSLAQQLKSRPECRILYLTNIS